MTKTVNNPQPPEQPAASPPDLRAFKLTIEYDGTRYAGWQRQANAPTVQQTLEEALERLLRHPVRCDGAGRTDSGVHALGQVATVHTTLQTIDAEGIRRGSNTALPADIRIVAAKPCALDFDPRRDARLRWYRYSILTRPTAPALDRQRLAHIPHPINWEAVEAGLDQLLGEHDFRAFRTASCGATRTILTLRKAEHVATGYDALDPGNPAPGYLDVHHLDFECRSYLHSQIRLMVGLLLEIGQGKHPPEVIRRALETGAIPVHFRIAPPEGLVLMRVEYSPNS